MQIVPQNAILLMSGSTVAAVLPVGLNIAESPVLILFIGELAILKIPAYRLTETICQMHFPYSDVRFKEFFQQERSAMEECKSQFRPKNDS